MKLMRSVLGLVLIAGLTPAPAREFTDKEGRKIEAEIDSVRPPNVILKRAGKSFLFPVAKLSEADQDFVKKWMVDNPEIKLEYRFTKEKIASEGDSERKKEDWVFEVMVENRGLTDIDGLKIDYTIFKQLHDRYSKGEKKRISGQVPGTLEIEKLEAQRKFVFKTEPIRIEKVNKVTRSGKGVEMTSTYEKWNEALTGITVKVSRDEKVVDEDTYGIVE